MIVYLTIYLSSRHATGVHGPWYIHCNMYFMWVSFCCPCYGCTSHAMAHKNDLLKEQNFDGIRLD
jgi:hypothetical protein